MSLRSNFSNNNDTLSTEADLDRFADVANKLADAAGEVIRKYFRNKFDILDKEDSSEFSLILFFFSYS